MAKEKSKQKSRIDKLDSYLFGSLYKAKRPLAIKQLARRVDVSWQTANKHVLKMQELKILDVTKQVRKNNVVINKDFLSHIKKKSLLKQEIDSAKDWLYE